jgi:hypothetical protein
MKVSNKNIKSLPPEGLCQGWPNFLTLRAVYQNLHMASSHKTHHFTHAFSSANTTILQKDSEVSLFESEIQIEMKRHKIISIIEIEIQLKLKFSQNMKAK